MADLLTLDEYKTYVGVPATNTKDDARTNALIPAASRMIQKYADRRFEQAGAPSPRTYQYDGSGFLETDDFTNLLTVETDAGYGNGQTVVLDPDQYTAQPYRAPGSTDDPSYYLIVNYLPGAGSGEMGFIRNLDTLELPQRPVLITVTATWGWAEIPEDVKLAVAWTVQDSLSKAATADLTSEAIAGYSRSWNAANGSNMLSIPNRARDLIANYERVF